MDTTKLHVTAFIGSARKKHTYNAAKSLLEKLETYGNVDTELVMLSEYNLQTCKGCKLCMDKGEEYCPLTDDRDILIKKIFDSDGIIFATPNYSFQVSGLIKTFLDRLGFFFHRPQFFGKTFTSIVAEGVYGGKGIVKYLHFVGFGMGFNLVKGTVIKTLEPITEKGKEKIENSIEQLSTKFYPQMIKKEYPNPSVIKLISFRMSRTSMKLMLTDEFKDYRYFTEKGWFESDYYYPVKLHILKKLIGKFFDTIAAKITKKR